eukprot:58022_1
MCAYKPPNTHINSLTLQHMDSNQIHSLTFRKNKKKRKCKWKDSPNDNKRKKRKKHKKRKRHKITDIKGTSQNPICILSDSDNDISIDTNIKQLEISYNIIYKSSDKILFIGEMDFSLSACIARVIGGYYSISTSYYDKYTLSKQFNKDNNFINKAKNNIKCLEYNGVNVMYGIDGTKLNTYCFKRSWG